jgi:phenylalanyl-tRNA synthetase beta chain
MNDGDPDLLGLSEDDARRQTVTVLNPVVQGAASLRTSLIPEMLRIVARNRNRGWNGPIRLFQIGAAFLAKPEEVLPREAERVALLWNGPAKAPHFAERQRDLDLFDVTGDLDAILESLGIRCMRTTDAPQPYVRAGSGFRLQVGEAELGYGGEIAPPLRRHLDLESPVFIVELEFDRLCSAMPRTRRFRAISPYPPVRRDLSLVVPRRISYERIVAILQRNLGDLLESHELFDVYAGEGLPAEHVALGIRLALRSSEETLKDRKVDGLISKLLADLEAAHGIRLRA